MPPLSNTSAFICSYLLHVASVAWYIAHYSILIINTRKQSKRDGNRVFDGAES